MSFKVYAVHNPSAAINGHRIRLSFLNIVAIGNARTVVYSTKVLAPNPHPKVENHEAER